MGKFYKIAVTVPVASADNVRSAIAEAGGGKVGNYSGCSFSSLGVGRFKPEAGASPTIGAVGEFESVTEERIEVRCEKEIAGKVIAAIKSTHPYEEVVLDVYELVEL